MIQVIALDLVLCYWYVLQIFTFVIEPRVELFEREFRIFGIVV